MEVIKPGKKQSRKRPVDDSKLPVRIEVLKDLSTIVPSHVWRCPPFKWDPLAFATESDELNQKFIEPSVQDKSLLTFLEKPSNPMIYGIAGNPDDSKAKLLAAYLVSAHCKALPEANVWWIPLYGSFDNPWLDPTKRRPSMIVLTGLTPQSTNIKLEKARDIIEAFPNVPRLIVIAGMDPLSFLTTKLHVPVHGIAYIAEKLVKQKVTVI